MFRFAVACDCGLLFTSLWYWYTCRDVWKLWYMDARQGNTITRQILVTHVIQGVLRSRQPIIQWRSALVAGKVLFQLSEWRLLVPRYNTLSRFVCAFPKILRIHVQWWWNIPNVHRSKESRSRPIRHAADCENVCCMYSCMMYAPRHVYVYIHLCVCVRIHVCVCVSARACARVCNYACICIHSHIHTKT